MAKKEKRKSHGGLITFLIIIILLLSFALFIVLFPTSLINISGKKVLDTIDLSKINELNAAIPSEGNFFISVHYNELELSKLIEDQLKKEWPVEQAAVSFNSDHTIDLAIASGDVQTLFQEQSIPSFLSKILSSRNIYVNISISLESGNRVVLNINHAFIDDLAIPVSLFDNITSEISDKIEESLNLIDGLTLQSISIDQSKIVIDGVLMTE
ncbi:MAG: hypothetical protein JXQ23_07460 [Clostridia bacterium]|nr:hypothetical protein [Clostridia bacterium]